MANQTDRLGGHLAKGVSERLEQLGMSRRELSRRTGLSRQTIHNIEHEGSINLRPSTFKALDEALKWKEGTALALALGVGDPASAIEARVHEYLSRIAIHLAHMSSEQLELTLIMMEENELGAATQSTEAFVNEVGELVKACLGKIQQLDTRVG